jgi:hypothetical protein
MQATAGQLYVGNWTKHFDGGELYNDTHDLIGVQTDNNWFAMTMINSYNKRSYLAGAAVPMTKRAQMKFGLVTGYDYFYENCGSHVMPFAAFSYRVKFVEINVIPDAISWGFVFDY